MSVGEFVAPACHRGTCSVHKGEHVLWPDCENWIGLESVEITPAQPGSDDTDEEAPVWRHLPDDRPTVQLGQVVNPPKVCAHPPEFVVVENLVARIEDDPVRWEIRVKALCAQCGVNFAVAREGHPPRDGSSGTVLALQPADRKDPPHG